METTLEQWRQEKEATQHSIQYRQYVPNEQSLGYQVQDRYKQFTARSRMHRRHMGYRWKVVRHHYT